MNHKLPTSNREWLSGQGLFGSNSRSVAVSYHKISELFIQKQLCHQLGSF
jgi:hypothetical protein